LEYRRNLPHFQPDGKALFITFRLFGTLPLACRRDGRSFVLADRELERTCLGPSWLKQPLVAECVAETIRTGAEIRGLYNLAAFVVMPNHVHVLIDPLVPAPKITQFVKGVSAKRANELLGRTGRAFWQDESFDHWVRSDTERGKIIRYIEFNPVHANLAKEPRLFRYSSAFGRNTD
jgi:putative transposase